MDFTNVIIGANYINARDDSFKKVIFPILDISADPTGACCIITDPSGHAVLIDTGRAANSTNVIAAMRTANIETIDAIFITHWHGDHYEGIYDIVQAFPDSTPDIIAALAAPTLYPASVTERNTAANYFGDKFITPTNNSEYTYFGVTFTTLNCSASDINYYEANSSDYNDCSMIVYAQYGDTVILNTGDIAITAQQRCVNNGYIIKNVDLITHPHHGGNSSGYTDFGLLTNPQFDYISNTPFSYSVGLRDPLFAAFKTAKFFDNASNRKAPVTFVFDSKGIYASGQQLDITSYADTSDIVLYCDPSITMLAEQYGTADKPFYSLRKAVTEIKKTGVINLLADTADTLVINGPKSITINGNGHSISSLSLIGGASVTLNNVTLGQLYLTNSQIYMNGGTVTGGNQGLIRSKATFYQTAFTYNGTQPIFTGSDNYIVFNAISTPNRASYLASVIASYVTGSVGLGAINSDPSRPLIRNYWGYSDFGRLSESSINNMKSFFDPATAPVFLFNTATNQIVHIKADGSTVSAAMA